MKIATWNVNSIRTRLEHLEKWVHSSFPDIILLQELKCLEKDFPFEAIESLGYNVAMHGQKSYNGVAVLSKFPIEDPVTTFAGDPDPGQARYLEVFTGGLRVASVYVPNGQEIDSDKYAYKLSFYSALQNHLKTLLTYDEKFVLGGDFNVAPFPQDMHNPDLSGTQRILCSEAEQHALRCYLTMGLHDALRRIHSQPIFTWWDYRQGSFPQNRGYRIDHLLISSSALDVLQDSNIDLAPRTWERPSDHTPLWATFKI